MRVLPRHENNVKLKEQWSRGFCASWLDNGKRKKDIPHANDTNCLYYMHSLFHSSAQEINPNSVRKTVIQ